MSKQVNSSADNQQRFITTATYQSATAMAPAGAQQFQSIAPAPQPGQQALQPQLTANPTGIPQGGQLMSTTGQQIQPMPIQLVQQSYTPNGVAQYATTMPQMFGQGMIIQPGGMIQGMHAVAGQPGQQYILNPVATPQKPGQPAGASQANSIVAASQQTAGKPMVSFSQANYTIAPAGGNILATSGSPQTFIMTNNMGAAQPMPGQPQSVTTTTMSSQGKPGDNKTTVSTSSQPNTQMPHQVILPQGMTFSYPAAGQGQQAFLHGQQIYLRPTGPSDSPMGNGQGAPQPQTGQIMFSPPATLAQPPSNVPGSAHQHAINQLQQPMMFTTSSAIRPMSAPQSVKNTAAKPFLPQTPKSFANTTMGLLLPQQLPTPQPSPKSKQKATPRTGSVLGRPSGPKSLENLKTPNGILSSSSSKFSNSSSLTFQNPPNLATLPTQPTQPTPTTISVSSASSYQQMPVLKPQMPTPVGQEKKIAPKPALAPTTIASKPTPTSIPVVPATTSVIPVGIQPDLSHSMPDAIKGSGNNVLKHTIDGHTILESSVPFSVIKKDSDLPFSNNDSKVPKLETLTTTNTSFVPPPQVIPTSQSLNSLISSVTTTTPSKVTSPQSASIKTSAPTKRGPGRPPGSGNKDKSGPTNKKMKSSHPLPQPPMLDPIKPVMAPQPIIAPEVPSPSKLPDVKCNARNWNVEQVCKFIRTLPDGEDFVDEFKLQEIDGQALLLLEVKHLRTVMAMSLGTALKVRNAIDLIREEGKHN